MNLIKHQVAYSIVSPDLRQPDAIKEYNDGIRINETSFYDTDNLVTTWYTQKIWGKAGQPVDHDEWLLSPQTVNAYYSPNSNQIALLAGILVNPLYNTTQPDYLNYGGIGMVAGHEITVSYIATMLCIENLLICLHSMHLIALAESMMAKVY